MSSLRNASSTSGDMDEEDIGDVHNYYSCEISVGEVENSRLPATPAICVRSYMENSKEIFKEVISGGKTTNEPSNISEGTTLDLPRVEDIIRNIPSKKLVKTTGNIKKKRNSEQRIPKRNTLMNYFPTINKSSIRQVITPAPITPANRVSTRYHQHTDRQIASTRSINQASKDTPRNDGTTTSAGKTWNPRSGKNYMGSTTNRSILMEFNKEQIQKGRSSQVYTYEEWNNKTPEKSLQEGFFGHSMDIIDNSMVFRVLLQNPNGINPDPRNQDIQLSFNACFDHCISLIGLTETNVEWGHYQQKENLRQSLKKWWDGSKIQTSTSIERFTGRYKPGGCSDQWQCREKASANNKRSC